MVLQRCLSLRGCVFVRRLSSLRASTPQKPLPATFHTTHRTTLPTTHHARHRTTAPLHRRMSTAPPVSSEPVKFSQSSAFRFRPDLPMGGIRPGQQETPAIQRWISLISWAVFMAYFCIFREENDIDQMLGGLTVEEQIEKYEIEELKKTLRNTDDAELREKVKDRLSALLFKSRQPGQA